MFLTACLLYEYLRFCGEKETCFWNFDRENLAIISPALTLKGLVNAIPMFVFGYNCHPSVFPIYKSMVKDRGIAATPRSAPRMANVFRAALSASFTAYTIAASSGFLLLLDEVPSNVLKYKYGRPDMVIAKVLFAIAMILAVPTFVIAIRATTLDMILLFRRQNDPEPAGSEPANPSDPESASNATPIPTARSGSASSASSTKSNKWTAALTPKQIARQKSAAMMSEAAFNNTAVPRLSSMS